MALARLVIVGEVLPNAAQGLNRKIRFLGLPERVIEERRDFIETHLCEELPGCLDFFGRDIRHVLNWPASALFHEEIRDLQRLSDALTVAKYIDAYGAALLASIKPVVVRKEH